MSGVRVAERNVAESTQCTECVQTLTLFKGVIVGQETISMMRAVPVCLPCA